MSRAARRHIDNRSQQGPKVSPLVRLWILRLLVQFDCQMISVPSLPQTTTIRLQSCSISFDVIRQTIQRNVPGKLLLIIV